MLNQERIPQLIAQWVAEGERCRKEADSLARNDSSRHATSIAMLEARAQTLDKCAVQVVEAMESARDT